MEHTPDNGPHGQRTIVLERSAPRPFTGADNEVAHMKSPHPWAIAYLVLGAVSGLAATSADGTLLQAGAAILTWTLLSLGSIYTAASWRQLRHGQN